MSVTLSGGASCPRLLVAVALGAGVGVAQSKVHTRATVMPTANLTCHNHVRFTSPPPGCVGLASRVGAHLYRRSRGSLSGSSNQARRPAPYVVAVQLEHDALTRLGFAGAARSQGALSPPPSAPRGAQDDHS